MVISQFTPSVQGILKAHLSPKLLEHADIKLTLDTYSHFLPSMGDYAANAMERALAQTRCATVEVNWLPIVLESSFISSIFLQE
jgi:hypothetical protein